MSGELSTVTDIKHEWGAQGEVFPRQWCSLQRKKLHTGSCAGIIDAASCQSSLAIGVEGQLAWERVDDGESRRLKVVDLWIGRSSETDRSCRN